MTKITKATIKSFIRKNEGCLYIKHLSKWDPTDDSLRSLSDPVFVRAEEPKEIDNYNLGVYGLFWMSGIRNTVYPFNNGEFQGYEIANCCGRWILAIYKP